MLGLVVVVHVVTACGKKSGSDDDPKTGTPSEGAAGELSDTSSAGIASFLQAGKFRGWTVKQAVPIDSVASHASKTQTFFNDTAGTAAKAGQNPLPKGSVVVKEIFAGDGITLSAQALMAKVDDGADGETWVWFEGRVPDLNQPYYGKGLATCAGCHASGTDFVRTTVP